MRLDAEYVLPLRWDDDHDLDDLASYLEVVVRWIDVTVVDGSEQARFAAHAAAFPPRVRQVAPASRRGNGKACGVVSGLALARHERVVIADDDVRHDRSSLIALVSGLRDADLVVPQNVFVQGPWHARWDTARSLVNRCARNDYPGTYAVRRSILAGGYDEETLFENLEMERTVRARGGRVRRRPDLFVPRRPPTARQFLGQRVRQAYDSLAQPMRMGGELALAPAMFALRRRPGILCLLFGASIVAAEIGRRRDHGRHVFSPSAALWAPLWVAERAVTSWIAVALRVGGGVPYAGRRMKRAATPLRRLRRATEGA